MKISNFKMREVLGTSPMNWKFRATIDVTTGFFRKDTETKEIFKNYGGNWFFIDSGEFTPGFDVDNLARSYAAQRGKELERCLDT